MRRRRREGTPGALGAVKAQAEAKLEEREARITLGCSCGSSRELGQLHQERWV